VMAASSPMREGVALVALMVETASISPRLACATLSSVVNAIAVPSASSAMVTLVAEEEEVEEDSETVVALSPACALPSKEASAIAETLASSVTVMLVELAVETSLHSDRTLDLACALPSRRASATEAHPASSATVIFPPLVPADSNQRLHATSSSAESALVVTSAVSATN
jgi:hypothetical protein